MLSFTSLMSSSTTTRSTRPMQTRARRMESRGLQVLLAILFGSTLVGSTLGAGRAGATPISDFNLIAFGNLEGTSEVEGRAAIQGNVSTGSTNYVTRAAGLSSPVSTNGLGVLDGLIIGGNVTGNPINVNNGANTRIGGTTGAIINSNGGGSVTENDAGVADIFADINFAVQSAETFFGSQTVNSTIDLSDGNRVVFDSNPVGGISVFQASSIDLFMRNGQFDLVGDLSADLFLIQVTGSNDISTSGLNPNSFEFNDDAFQSRIVFFFEDADENTDLQFNGGLGGSILARLADLEVTTSLEGTVIVNDITLNGEIHLPTASVPIPEPSAALLIGFGLMVMWLRQERA